MTGRGRTRSYGQDACETTANASERPRTYCSALQAANHWLALASIGGRVERAMGIEPTAQAWEAWVLPLYDARASWILCASPRSAQILRPGRRLARGLDLHQQILAANIGLQIHDRGRWPQRPRQNPFDCAQIRRPPHVDLEFEPIERVASRPPHSIRLVQQ